MGELAVNGQGSAISNQPSITTEKMDRGESPGSITISVGPLFHARRASHRVPVLEAFSSDGPRRTQKRVNMKKRHLISAGFVVLAFSGWIAAADPPVGCKSVKHYNVTGCEVLPDQTCPAGYHKQAVDPPNPMMKSPSYLMCVADEPPAKKLPPKRAPKPNR